MEFFDVDLRAKLLAKSHLCVCWNWKISSWAQTHSVTTDSCFKMFDVKVVKGQHYAFNKVLPHESCRGTQACDLMTEQWSEQFMDAINNLGFQASMLQTGVLRVRLLFISSNFQSFHFHCWERVKENKTCWIEHSFKSQILYFLYLLMKKSQK